MIKHKIWNLTYNYCSFMYCFGPITFMIFHMVLYLTSFSIGGHLWFFVNTKKHCRGPYRESQAFWFPFKWFSAYLQCSLLMKFYIFLRNRLFTYFTFWQKVCNSNTKVTLKHVQHMYNILPSKYFYEYCWLIVNVWKPWIYNTRSVCPLNF